MATGMHMRKSIRRAFVSIVLFAAGVLAILILAGFVRPSSWSRKDC